MPEPKTCPDCNKEKRYNAFRKESEICIACTTIEMGTRVQPKEEIEVCMPFMGKVADSFIYGKP